MNSCMVGGLQVVVLSLEFHQNRLSGYGAVGGRNLPFPTDWPLAYTTACTTVQAVIKTYCKVLPHLHPVGHLGACGMVADLWWQI